MGADRDSSRLVVVARFDYPYQAQLAQLQLESAGIPAVLADAHVIGTSMFYSQALGGVKVKVPENRKAEALAILSQSENEDEEGSGEQDPMGERQ